MKSLFKTSLSLLLASLLFTSCATYSTHEDAKTEEYSHFKEKHDLKKIHDTIMKTGVKEGWRMTKFKNNSILAEKTSDNETQAYTIDFTKSSLIVIPKNSSLEESLIRALDK